ncbi:MAG: ATP synthase F0 subcomplex subunit OSCP atp5 [Cirrosporium novae-zelandiae]|nr:MAG: ATP synthase F0 subcomplex subunit OSCP atp5 [Cirrosporium novae-zelandiae]
MLPIRSTARQGLLALSHHTTAISRPAAAASLILIRSTHQKSQKRTYAAPAAVDKDVKPPVALFGIDGTYASALYTASAKTSNLDATARALSSLAQVFKRDPKLTSILNAPSLTVTDKEQIVAELQKHTGGAGGDVLKNFLATLAENNRLGILEGVCDKFTVLMGAHKGEMEVTVTSAARLDSRTLSRLESAVGKSQFSQGKKLKVVQKVDSSLLGGLVVEVGDRTIDLSVSSKISKLNKLLTDTL